MYNKANKKTSSTHEEPGASAKKPLKETLKSCKTNPIDSDPTKFITISVEVCSIDLQGLLEALEQVNKMIQKFVETRLLKKLESIYSLITQNYTDRNKIIKTATSNVCFKRRYISLW